MKTLPYAGARPERVGDHGHRRRQDDRITTGWYVTLDPTERPTLVTTHLAGLDGPLSMEGRDIDCRHLKVRHEFGAAVMDWRSMVFTPAS
jgi:hypothetical protein